MRAGRVGVGLARLATIQTTGKFLVPSALLYPGINPHTAACPYLPLLHQLLDEREEG
jgi:hypothetical protein